MPAERQYEAPRAVAAPIIGAVSLLLLIGAGRELAPLPPALEAGWKGEKVCEILHEHPSIRLARCSFAPGVGHERHWHPPHMGYALSAARMRIDGADGIETRDVPAGASWSEADIITHEALNVGETTARYLIAEPGDEHITSSAEETNAASGEAVPDAIAAGWQGRPVCELLQENQAYRMVRCTYPPGIGQGPHRHGPYVGYVTKGGRMRVESADGVAVQEFTDGDVYSSDGIAWHSALNVGETEFQTVIFEAPDS